MLYDDDYLAIYKKPKEEGVAMQPLHRINMRKRCKQILAGHLCYKWKSMQFPNGVLDLDALFTVKTKFLQYRHDFVFAAFDATQRHEWETVLQNAQGKATCGDIFEEGILRRNCGKY